MSGGIRLVKSPTHCLPPAPFVAAPEQRGQAEGRGAAIEGGAVQCLPAASFAGLRERRGGAAAPHRRKFAPQEGPPPTLPQDPPNARPFTCQRCVSDRFIRRPSPPQRRVPHGLRPSQHFSEAAGRPRAARAPLVRPPAPTCSAS